jgi:hypothetical protein
MIHEFIVNESRHFADRILVFTEPAFYGILIFAALQVMRPAFRSAASRSWAAILIFVSLFLVNAFTGTDIHAVLGIFFCRGSRAFCAELDGAIETLDRDRSRSYICYGPDNHFGGLLPKDDRRESCLVFVVDGSIDSSFLRRFE